MAESEAGCAVAELVERVRSGDTAAFGLLYEAHVAIVHRVVRDHVRDREAVADLVQEVFARALRALVTLRQPDRFRPWLCSIARHTAVDWVRGQRETRALDALDKDIASDERGPEEIAQLRELADLVRGCVLGLSPRDATAITLVTRLGFSPDDVAVALAVSPGAAKVIVHRARRRLRHALALQLLVRREGGGCPALSRLLEGGNLLAAGRHVRSCGHCSQLASEELRLQSQGQHVHVPA